MLNFNFLSNLLHRDSIVHTNWLSFRMTSTESIHIMNEIIHLFCKEGFVTKLAMSYRNMYHYQRKTNWNATLKSSSAASAWLLAASVQFGFLSWHFSIMGCKCCVPGCRQGYHGVPRNKKISFHRFPNEQYDPDLLKKWLDVINPLFKETKCYTPRFNSRVCSLHFEPSDLVQTSIDTKMGRKVAGQRQINRPLQVKYVIYAD